MDYIWPLLQLLFMLSAVILLAYLVLNKGLGRWIASQQKSATMSVEERLLLGPKLSLYIVNIRDKKLVLAGSEHGISVVCDLNENSSL